MIYVYYAVQSFSGFSSIITGVTHSSIFDLEFQYSTFSTNIPVVRSIPLPFIYNERDIRQQLARPS